MNNLNYSFWSAFNKNRALLPLNPCGIRGGAEKAADRNYILLFYHTEPKEKLGFIIWLTEHSYYFFAFEPKDLMKVKNSSLAPINVGLSFGSPQSYQHLGKNSAVSPMNAGLSFGSNGSVKKGLFLPPVSQRRTPMNAGFARGAFLWLNNIPLYKEGLTPPIGWGCCVLGKKIFNCNFEWRIKCKKLKLK